MTETLTHPLVPHLPPDAQLTSAELFAGYGGLGMAVERIFNAKTIRFSEFEEAPSAILAHHWPGVKNYGDVTQIDWANMPRPNILSGGFPCFTAGTLVTCDDGPHPIEDLRIGDLVLTHERRWRPVVQVMSKHNAPTYEVKAMGAPVTTTTAEHPFYVRRTRQSSPEWVNTADLEPGMFLALPDTEIDPTEHVTEYELSVAYLIGRWLGDGWTVTHERTSNVPQGQRGSRVNSVARRVHWCCATDEEQDLEKAFAAAGINPTKARERTVTKYVMQSTNWADILDQFGKYAHGKKVPEYVHARPVAWQEALVRGWLDSDGDVKADGTLNGTTASQALAIGMARVMRTVYGKPIALHQQAARSGHSIEGRAINARATYNVRVAPGPSKIAFQADGFTWVPLRSVKATGKLETVYNIGVGQDESYVANGITVHNCQDVSLAGRRAGMTGDTRSGLWFHFLRGIIALQPEYVLAENVRGILSAKAVKDLPSTPETRELDAYLLDLTTEREAIFDRVNENEYLLDAVRITDTERLEALENHISSIMEQRTGLLGTRPDEPILRALGAVCGDLADAGYDAQWCGLRAADVGAPHGRFRVFILGTRRDLITADALRGGS